MNKVRKAVIPCGGLGTRFLPVTKAVPKEILPVIDTPVLSFIVDELIESGVDSILIVLGKGKESIREYFTENEVLKAAIEKKPELLECYRQASKRADISFVTQPAPKGSGDALMLARDFTGDDPFIMANGDDLIIGEPPASKQLTDAYKADNRTVLGVQRVAPCETSKYGIISTTEIIGRKLLCSSIAEKPKSDPPSLYASLGRYVFTPEIYDSILNTPARGGEVCLTDAISSLMGAGRAYSYEFIGRRYDMGDKFGALTATVDFALKRPELSEKFKQYLKSVLVDAD